MVKISFGVYYYHLAFSTFGQKVFHRLHTTRDKKGKFPTSYCRDFLLTQYDKSQLKLIFFVGPTFLRQTSLISTNND